MARICVAFRNGIFYDQRSVGDDIPCFYECFIKELTESGNDVLVFNHSINYHDDFTVPLDIEKKIKDFDPQCCIVFNNDFYDLSKVVDCNIIIYEVDSILYYQNKKSIRNDKNRYFYFVSQSNSIDVLANEFGIRKSRIVWVPFFSSIKNINIPKKHNICFIGSNFSANSKLNSCIERFVNDVKSDELLASYRNMLNDFCENPYVDEKLLFERNNIPHEYRGYFDRHELVKRFSGSSRIDVLNQISDLDLVIYGTYSWLVGMTCFPDIVLCFRNQLKYSFNDNQEIYNSSKIGININHLQATSGFSWRVCDIMASDSCLVSVHTADIEKLFPGIHIPLFHNKFEARKICQDLLLNENKRKDIVLSCNEMIDKNYRFNNILNCLNSIVPVNVNGEKGKCEIVTLRGDNSGVFEEEILDIKKRLKNAIYLCALFFGQFPLLDLIINKKVREKLYGRLKKYSR